MAAPHDRIWLPTGHCDSSFSGFIATQCHRLEEIEGAVEALQLALRDKRSTKAVAFLLQYIADSVDTLRMETAWIENRLEQVRLLDPETVGDGRPTGHAGLGKEVQHA